MSNYESYTSTGSGMQGQSSGSGLNQSGNTDTFEQAKQKTGEVVDQVQDKAGEVASTVKEQAASQISSQKDKAAEGLGSVADAFRQTSHQLRKNDQAGVAEYVDKAAQSVDKFSSYLRDRDLNEIVYGVESFARREPALFIGGAFTLGLLAARFLRSSAPTQTGNTGSAYSSYSRQLPGSGYGSGYGSNLGRSSYGSNLSGSSYGSNLGGSSYGQSPVVSSSTLKIDTFEDQETGYRPSGSQYNASGTAGGYGSSGSGTSGYPASGGGMSGSGTSGYPTSGNESSTGGSTTGGNYGTGSGTTGGNYGTGTGSTGGNYGAGSGGSSSGSYNNSDTGEDSRL